MNFWKVGVGGLEQKSECYKSEIQVLAGHVPPEARRGGPFPPLPAAGALGLLGVWQHTSSLPRPALGLPVSPRYLPRVRLSQRPDPPWYKGTRHTALGPNYRPRFTLVTSHLGARGSLSKI